MQRPQLEQEGGHHTRSLAALEASLATHGLVDGHSELNIAPKPLGHSSAHWDIGHRDDLNRDSLVPLIPEVLRIFPGKKEPKKYNTVFNS